MSTLQAIIMRRPRVKRLPAETGADRAARDALALAPPGLMRVSGW